MDFREREAVVRLLVISGAWALGEALEWQLGATALGPVLPLILAAAAFMATRGVSFGGGGEAYWRGRRIDRDRWRH